MSRAAWKVPYIPNLFLSNLFKKAKNLNVWDRSAIISPLFVNRRFRVHNGIWLLTLNVKSGMVGHKFGEFSFTKRMGKSIHIKKKVKKTKK